MNTTIAITQTLKEQIMEFGSKGETYNQILERILENTKKRQIQELLMDEKDCLPIEKALTKAKKRWQE